MTIESMFGRFKITRAAFDAVSKLLHFQVRGLGDAGNDDAAEGGDDATFLQQLGFASRPVVTSTLRALAVRWGSELWVLKVWDKANLPTDLEEGETRAWGAGEPSARVRIRGNGDIEILMKAGQVTSIGGAVGATQFTLPGADLRTWLLSLEAKVNGLTADMILVKSHVHPAGTPSTLVSPTITTVGGEGAIGDPPALSTTVKTAT